MMRSRKAHFSPFVFSLRARTSFNNNIIIIIIIIIYMYKEYRVKKKQEKRRKRTLLGVRFPCNGRVIGIRNAAACRQPRFSLFRLSARRFWLPCRLFQLPLHQHIHRRLRPTVRGVRPRALQAVAYAG